MNAVNIALLFGFICGGGFGFLAGYLTGATRVSSQIEKQTQDALDTLRGYRPITEDAHSRSAPPDE